jgi:excisionase family DNA binding protein
MQPITSVDRITRITTRPRVIGPTRAEVAPSTIEPVVQREVGTQMASMAAQQLGPMLTASEVAELLHLHVNTVKRLGDRGELPFYRVCKRGDRRFRLDDVLTFLAVNR